MNRGTRIVLTAPFTEMIDHTGYFIQMGMASIPIWMEWVTAAEFGRDNVVVCYPHDLDQFIGPDTGIVALSTHDPLGVTFAAGVYTSIFGSSREPTKVKTRAELLTSIKPNYWNYLREDAGDIPAAPPPPAPSEAVPQLEAV